MENNLVERFKCYFLWPPIVMGRPLYFPAVVTMFLLFFSPILSCFRQDVYHTSTHDVALARIISNRPTCLKCAARGSLKIQDATIIAQKSPSAHHRTHLSGYIFATKACIDNRRIFLYSSISATCLHNMVNFGPLTAKIGWSVWGTPANFNGFRVSASLLHRRRSTEVNQTSHDVWSFPGLVIHFGAVVP